MHFQPYLTGQVTEGPRKEYDNWKLVFAQQRVRVVDQPVQYVLEVTLACS